MLSLMCTRMTSMTHYKLFRDLPFWWCWPYDTQWEFWGISDEVGRNPSFNQFRPNDHKAAMKKDVNQAWDPYSCADTSYFLLPLLWMGSMFQISPDILWFMKDFLRRTFSKHLPSQKEKIQGSEKNTLQKYWQWKSPLKTKFENWIQM